jgi:hypothetical protein
MKNEPAPEQRAAYKEWLLADARDPVLAQFSVPKL